MRKLFEPKVGMKTNDSYLHGIGDNMDICVPGHIEHVGEDYFVLRVQDNESRPLFVSKKQYWAIEQNDFTLN